MNYRNRPDDYGYEPERRMTREEAMARRRRAQQIRRRRQLKRKITLVVILLILLALIAGGIFFVLGKLGKIERVKLGSIKTYQDSGPYTNIVLYGLDSREGELSGGVNSDTIIICSINNENHEVKLVSVYRDSYLMQQNGYFAKANSAYQKGPEDSINMLNENLDLDIKNYIAVNFSALVDTVDLLGGIDLELTAEEAYWLDGYVTETSQVVGVEPNYLPNQDGGTYHLDGVQATAYCRIRYTAGYDMKRTERQRIVLGKVLEAAKQASPSTINKIVDKVFPNISTSLTNSELLSMAVNVTQYTLKDTTGFPFDQKPDWKDDNGAESVVPIDLAANVAQLHTWLFPDQTYSVSSRVQEISDTLMNVTGVTGSEDTYEDSETEDSTYD